MRATHQILHHVHNHMQMGAHFNCQSEIQLNLGPG